MRLVEWCTVCFLPLLSGVATVDLDDERKEEEERLHKLAERNAPEGWTAFHDGPYLVITEGSKTRAKKLSEQLSAVYSWLGSTFSYIAEGRYMRAPILYVYEDWEGMTSAQIGAETEWSSLEILTWRGEWGTVSSAFDYLNERAQFVWFSDRNDDLYTTFPQWIASGLHDLLGDSHNKNGKLVFREESWDKLNLDRARRSGELAPIRQLFLYNAEDFGRDDSAYAQAGQLMQFLAGKKTNKNKRYLGLLEEYIENLTVVGNVVRAELGGELDEEARSSPVIERRLLDETFDLTFSEWSAKDWKALDKAFVATIN